MKPSVILYILGRNLKNFVPSKSRDRLICESVNFKGRKIADWQTDWRWHACGLL